MECINTYNNVFIRKIYVLTDVYELNGFNFNTDVIYVSEICYNYIFMLFLQKKKKYSINVFSVFIFF